MAPQNCKAFLHYISAGNLYGFAKLLKELSLEDRASELRFVRIDDAFVPIPAARSNEGRHELHEFECVQFVAS